MVDTQPLTATQVVRAPTCDFCKLTKLNGKNVKLSKFPLNFSSCSSCREIWQLNQLVRRCKTWENTASCSSCPKTCQVVKVVVAVAQLGKVVRQNFWSFSCVDLPLHARDNFWYDGDILWGKTKHLHRSTNFANFKFFSANLTNFANFANFAYQACCRAGSYFGAFPSKRYHHQFRDHLRRERKR